jgi:hypothetical protein
MRRGVLFACVTLASLTAMAGVASCELVDGLGSLAYQDSATRDVTDAAALNETGADTIRLETSTDSGYTCDSTFGIDVTSMVLIEYRPMEFTCVELRPVNFAQFTEWRDAQTAIGICAATGHLDGSIYATNCGKYDGAVGEGGIALVNMSCDAYDYCLSIGRYVCGEDAVIEACSEDHLIRSPEGAFFYPGPAMKECVVVSPDCDASQAMSCNADELLSFRCCATPDNENRCPGANGRTSQTD